MNFLQIKKMKKKQIGYYAPRIVTIPKEIKNYIYSKKK